MLTDEAIEKVRDAGFSASEANWSLGKTIFCGKLDPRQDSFAERPAPLRYEKMLYLFPTEGGWGLELPDIVPVTDKDQSFTLEAACELVIGILASPFVPLRENEMEVSDEMFLHQPTGICRKLFEPEPGHQKVLTTKNEALREIVYELGRRQEV